VNLPSTKKIYFQGLFGSLINLVVISLYSLLVVRLSLAYLDKSQFGLLSLSTQISVYIAVIDLGLFTAFSRILIDYNHGDKKLYANALKTASIVFISLGAVAALLATTTAFFGHWLFAIPDALRTSFTYLLLGQAFVLFVGFAVKPVSAPLIAAGRHYYIYWVTTALTVLNLAVFWVCLRCGVGIYSALAGNVTMLLLNMGVLYKLSMPYRATDGLRGIFDFRVFKEVSSFARDSMLWQIGGQTLGSLPLLLASSWFVLGATADLSGGLKLVLLMLSICTRFGDMAVTPLSIQFAAGEKTKAATQMLKIASASGGVGVVAAMGIVCCNQPFIQWWMLGEIHWSWSANLAGALWVALTSVTQCMNGYAVISRQMQIIRWSLLAECVAYICIAFTFRSLLGLSSLVWALVLAKLLISFYVGVQLRKKTELDTSKLLLTVMRVSLVLAVIVPISYYCNQLISSHLCNSFWFMISSSGVAAALLLVSFPILFERDHRLRMYKYVEDVIAKFRTRTT
jgi:O-antigen/teichoic acid export membrane protein